MAALSDEAKIWFPRRRPTSNLAYQDHLDFTIASAPRVQSASALIRQGVQRSEQLIEISRRLSAVQEKLG